MTNAVESISQKTMGDWKLAFLNLVSIVEIAKKHNNSPSTVIHALFYAWKAAILVIAEKFRARSSILKNRKIPPCRPITWIVILHVP